MATTPRPNELAEAIATAAADQRENYPDLSNADAVELIRRNFVVAEDAPHYPGNWAVSVNAQNPVERAYALVRRATPDELAAALAL
ncbi:hypothetical protein ABT095_15010 [Kitasatospora sp. NPDC002227]|uniref:hypothetical protein n=1 Tax=Kitasatospora sp. NPDC002227 TaxID=3154773 RepID=UPI00332F6F1C